VAAQLEPAPELSVVRQEKTASLGRENPGRRRDVTGNATAVETVAVLPHEILEAVHARILSRISKAISFELGKKRIPMHPVLRSRTR